MNPGESIDTVYLDRLDCDLERLRRPKDTVIEKMRRSLKDQGQLTPVIVVKD